MKTQSLNVMASKSYERTNSVRANCLKANRQRSLGFPLLLLCIAIAACLASLSAKAQDLPGKAKATTCKACHGPAGISPNELWPNIAGQKATYLTNQLQAFRSGERSNPLMSPISKMLSDQDIIDLSAYFAAGAP